MASAMPAIKKDILTIPETLNKLYKANHDEVYDNLTKWINNPPQKLPSTISQKLGGEEGVVRVKYISSSQAEIAVLWDVNMKTFVVERTEAGNIITGEKQPPKTSEHCSGCVIS